MSAEVNQFVEMVQEHLAALESVKMLNQGRQWCERCKAWTFSHQTNGACSLCHSPRKQEATR